MKAKIKLALFVLLTSSNISTIFSQQILTLNECIDYALQNNTRIKNARNDISMAKHTSQEAFTKYFPSISASGSGFNANKGMFEISISPEMKMSMLKNGLIGGVTASMPLFTGGQIVNGNKLAKTEIEISKLQYNLSENEVKLTTEKYFWQIVILKEKLHTITTIEKQLERLTNDVETSVNAGITTKNDLLQINLQKNETENLRINTNNSLIFYKKLLAQYMGMTTDSIEVSFVTANSMPESPDELYINPQISLLQTHEYQLLQQNVKACQIQKNMAIGKNLPTIAIGGGYVYNNLLDKDDTFWVGLATVSVPLSGWWEGSHNISKQKLQLHNAENQLADQSQLLMIQIENTWNELNNTYQQIGIAINSIEQSTENLRLHNDYYNAGTCTMTDLLNAQTLYQKSHDQYIEAYANYEIKKREYLQMTGR